MNIREVLMINQTELGEAVDIGRTRIVEFEKGNGKRKELKLINMYYIEKVIHFDEYLNKKSLSKSVGAVIRETGDHSWVRIISEEITDDEKEKFITILKDILIKEISGYLNKSWGMEDIDKLRKYIMLEL